MKQGKDKPDNYSALHSNIFRCQVKCWNKQTNLNHKSEEWNPKRFELFST